MNGCPCKEEDSVIQGEKPQDGGDSDWKIHLVALKKDQLHWLKIHISHLCLVFKNKKKRKPPMRTCGVINHPTVVRKMSKGSQQFQKVLTSLFHSP